MRQCIDQPLTSGRLRLIILLIFIFALDGCAVLKGIQEKYRPAPKPPEEKVEKKEAPPAEPVEEDDGPLAETIERNEFSVAKGEDVIGRLALIRLKKGDTLPDIARHFSLGLNGVGSANPGVDLWVPRAGERIMLPLNFILPDAPRKGIVINLATMRLFRFKADGESSTKVVTFPVGVGTSEKPTPQGKMYVQRKATKPSWHVPASIAADHRKKGDILPAVVPPGPQNPLGEYALYLSEATYLIHGTNKPASIGLRATNGCIRLYPEDVKRLYEDTPVKTPVVIINQPYLIGRCNGVLYMEAHASSVNLDAAELEKIYKKLRNIEKELGRTLDWNKVKNVVAEARGIPVPIFEISQGNGTAAVETIQVRHPDKLYGKPEIPALNTEAWHVLAAEVRDEIDALRLAAIINHQGPPIPARAVSKGNGYSIIAGPFKDINEAKDAVKRLKIDLELNGTLIESEFTK